MNIVEKLRQEIERVGVYRVAVDNGLNVANVAKFVRGERGITLENAAKVAAYLGLELKSKKGGGKS